MPKSYIPNDKLSQKARQEGFRARSVFKLEELDQKFHLLKPGQIVLDLGAAPGSWLQYVSKKIGSEGLGIGLDLKSIDHIADNIITHVLDITQIDDIRALLRSNNVERVDLLLSDIAPNTTGIKYVDQKRSIELNLAIFKLSQHFLKPGGRLVMKVFPGEDFDAFIKQLKRYFNKTQVMKAKASRDRSREVYIICQN